MKELVKTVLFTVVFLLTVGTVAAVDQLLSLQGKVTLNGANVADGNIEVTIFDAATGGNLIYNSTNNFNNVIQNGIFDVMLGSITTLDLNYNKLYYLDIKVNGVDIDWNGVERKTFESTSGDTMAGNFKLESGNLKVCQSDDLCITIEQTTYANITTNTGDLYLDPEGNTIYLDGKTVALSSFTVESYITIKGGKITFNGTSSSGDIYMDTNNDIVIDPQGGDIVLVIG